jgi:hypothetical protein
MTLTVFAQIAFSGKRRTRELHPADRTRGLSNTRSDRETYIQNLFVTPTQGPPGLTIVVTPQNPHSRWEHPKFLRPQEPCPPRAKRLDRDRYDLIELTYRNQGGVPLALARCIRVVDFSMRRLPPPELDPTKPTFSLERNWIRMIDIGRRNDKTDAIRGIMTIVGALTKLARSAGAVVFTESQELATILRAKGLWIAPSEHDREAFYKRKA